ncbi:MAG: RICIN domain-containing protein [Mogibacterium sp.]|nr:RICIN domain-containing protein [Mogibacterium sp.]
MKRKLLSMVLMMSIVFTIHTMISYAASFSADDLIAHAKSHIGQKVSQFTDSSGASGKWCAWFVEHCSSQLGYSSIIPTSGCEDVNNLAYSIVNNKNGTITFVNETFYKAKKSNFNARAYLNKSYQPRKGDLIIFSSDGDYWWTHVGIVRENCSSPLTNVKTIEGNTGNDTPSLATVMERTRSTTSDFNIVAYVTPNYSNTSSSYKVSYNLNGGSGSFATQNVAYNSQFTIYSGKPTKSGETFKCWYLRRLKDNKWYVGNMGWYTWSEIEKNNYTPRAYDSGYSMTINSNWIKDGGEGSDFSLVAQWTPVGSQVVSNGRYQIVSALDDNECVTVSSESTADGANIQLYTSRANAKQTFTFKYLSDGYYSIQSYNSGKYMEVAGGSVHTGANVQQGNATLSDAKKWVVVKNSDGTYSLRAKCSGKYLYLNGGSAAKSTNIIVSTGDSSKAQKFYLVEYDGTNPLADGRYYIASAMDRTEFITVASESTEDGANIRLYPTVSNPNQSWYVEHIGAGYYSITNAKSGKGFDVEGKSGASGANLRQWTYSGDTNQMWLLKRNSDGSYRMTCRTGGKAVSIKGGSAVNGANVQMDYPGTASSQKWIFVKFESGSSGGGSGTGDDSGQGGQPGDISGGDGSGSGTSGSTTAAVKPVTKPHATKIVKLTRAKKAITVKWKKVSGVNGYQIQLATNKSFTKGKKTVNINKKSTVSKKVKKLKAKKKYYVRVRTYKVVNGTKYYSAWSPKKAIKTK